ncbi:hypothetical protein M758_UG155400 [Ceratodon purpureus]|nr:hypothetical protein M758_UG155400 [Ceratodon purpureus]
MELVTLRGLPEARAGPVCRERLLSPPSVSYCNPVIPEDSSRTWLSLNGTVSPDAVLLLGVGGVPNESFTV